MICHEFKGGIGTASRKLPGDEGGWTVGALVQANYGRRSMLRVDGAPVGRVLTTEQMAERDRTVFTVCARMGVPVVTNLAGGYQRPVSKVVALHVQTLSEFDRVRAAR